MRILVVLSIFVIFCFANQDCKSCHNIESFDKQNHDFDCIKCHVLPTQREEFTHKDIITHPASFKYVDVFCSSCHKNDIKKFKSSNHYTLKNEINTVFKTFGLDTNYTLQSLPKAPKIIKTKKGLVIDLLRRKCLKCHVETKKIYELGSYRGKGCMSCHAKYASDGRYKGKDKSIKDRFGFAKSHRLSKTPPMSACLSCHNKEFVGGDYLGLFPKDYDKSYRSPITKDGKFPPMIHGIDFHHLNKDIHVKAGLKCSDCHDKKSILGQTEASCKTCHKNLTAKNHEYYHKNLSCTSCHASWQMSHYELSLLRDDTPNYIQWKRLQVQEDGYLQKFLEIAMKSKIKPKMPDFIDGKMREGIWYSGWKIRRWENLLLGNDTNAKVQILRPFFQYRLSYKNRDNKMVFDDFFQDKSTKFEAFMPYTPHTIAKRAKSCEACHENPLKKSDFLNIFEGKTLKSTPLTKEQIQKLHSKKYKKTRAKMLLNPK